MVHLELRDLAPGARLHLSPDRRWKTTLLIARIAAPLDADPTRGALVPAVLARGTERSPTARDLTIRLESLYDAELEGDAIRIGDAQVIELRLEVIANRYVPAGGRDPLAEAVELLAEVLHRPALDAAGRFRADVVRGEKENLRHHIEGLRDERADYAIERAFRLLGRGEPSARYEYGAVADLRAIGPADLTARWRDLVNHHPLDLLAVGDFDPAALETLVRGAFPLGGRAAPTRRPAPPSVAPRPGEPVRERERADVKQAHLCMGYRTGIAYLDRDYAALLVLNAVLGADAQSRLFLNVREEAGLAYEAGTVLDRAKGTITAHCGIDPDNAARCEALVAAEVARLRDALVPRGELEEARKFTLQKLSEVEDDPGLRVAFSYARALFGREAVTYEELLARLGDVTAAEVQAVAQKMALDCVFLLTR